MQKKPQIHFWRERITELSSEHGYVWAIHCCRAWDEPSNGVFMLFTSTEIYSGPYDQRITNYRDLLRRKLEEKEHALLNYYGPRLWKKRLLDDVVDDGAVVTSILDPDATEHLRRRTADSLHDRVVGSGPMG